MELKEVDTFTWRPVMVSSYMEETKQILEEDTLSWSLNLEANESKRVVSLLEEILVDVGEAGYYFSEEHGVIDRYEEYLASLQWNYVYDSSQVYRLGNQDVYNIIQIARTPHPEFNDYWYLAVSLNGSNLSSAPTEYLRFRWKNNDRDRI
jgi:hypothetical protein|tara:strand:- start:20 stop:469 length:450 start_codon:yes stop_codon:yes gene_type:complete